MNFIDVYLNKHSFIPYIKTLPLNDLRICLVIPCFKETNLTTSLESLWNCTRPNCSVEFIILINNPEDCPAEAVMQNSLTIIETTKWISKHVDTRFAFHIIHKPNLPKKHAGVGLARKLGMDEALYRLNITGKTNGIIAGFDADSTCDQNYFVELEKHFDKHPKTGGCSIYFEHPTSGKHFSDEIYEGIVLYELHLRYLNQALRYTGHPFAWQTIGSAFAVRMDIYAQQGGMNKRQAGEDFYFLQKVIEASEFTELNTTRVIPSPRQSDRVPFGTGAAMNKWEKEKQMLTYQFKAYQNLKLFFNLIKNFFLQTEIEISNQIEKLPNSIKIFLEKENAASEIIQAKENAASLFAFEKRFFRWFNAFKAIKYLNFVHEYELKKGNIDDEVAKFLNIRAHEAPIETLQKFREMDKRQI